MCKDTCYTIFESICNYAEPFYSDGHNNGDCTFCERTVDPLIGDIDDWAQTLCNFIIYKMGHTHDNMSIL